MCTTFNKKAPCNNCPYLKSAPRQHWSIEEFKDLIASDNDYFGKVYGCHKNDGSVCVGWLINQDDRRLPSIALRMALSNNKVSMEYLDNLSRKKEMFKTIKEMSEANYPELKQFS